MLLAFGTPGVIGSAGLAGYLHKMSNFDYVLPDNPIGGNLGCLEGFCPEIDLAVNHSYISAQRWVPPLRDPLTFDLDGDGLETTGIAASNPILFDHDGDGVKTATGWVMLDDAFLVLDRNGNGSIDTGAELFGDATPLNAGGLASDGFAALADVDDNHDGTVNSADSVFANLRLWRDFSQDGISDAGELFTLNDLGIASINVGKTQHSQLLPDGNRIADLGTYTKVDGSTGGLGETSMLADIDLSEDTFHSQFTDQLPISEEIAALPGMSGSGMVRDLREAVTLSQTLRDLLVQFSQTSDRTGQLALLDSILEAWSETSTMPTTYTGAYAGHSRVTTPFDGGSASDAAWRNKIDILERFNGRTLRQVPAGTGPVVVEIYDGTLTLLQQSYDQLKASVYQALALQTRFKPLLDLVQIELTDQGAVFNLSAVESELNDRIALSQTKGIADLIEFTLSTRSMFTDAQWAGWRMVSDAHVAEYMTPELAATLRWQGISIDGQTGYAAQGTNNDDVNIGDEGADSINGGGGSDVLVGAGGNDILQGESGDDLLVGGGGNDVLYGGTGNDTYMFWAGSGNDAINEYNLTGGNVDTVRLVGQLPSQVSLRRTMRASNEPTADLLISVDGTADRLTIHNYFGGTPYKVERLVFDDGTVWGTADLDAAPFDLRDAAGTTIIRNTGNRDDTYLFAAGSGQDAISDYDLTSGNVDTVRLVGLLPSQVSLRRTMGASNQPTADLLISVDGTADQLTIYNYFGGTPYKVERLVFDDGTVWGTAELDAASFDLRDAAGTTIIRNTGNWDDTYLFAAGSGQDAISDYDLTSGNVDTVRLVGLLPSQVSLRRTMGANNQPTADLLISVDGTADQLTIYNYFFGTANRIERLVFDDGTVWGTAEMDATPIYPTTTDSIFGRNDAGDYFNLRHSSNANVSGNAIGTLYDSGNDTYIFGPGSGSDAVLDYGSSAGSTDTVRMEGVDSSDVTLLRSVSIYGNAYDLVLKLNDSTDQLAVRNYFAGGSNYKIERVVFDDGTVWSTTELDRAPIYPTASGTTNGTSYVGDYFDLRHSSNTTAYGDAVGGLYDSGNDTYIFGPGSGSDTVIDYGTVANNTDTVKMIGVNPSEVTLVRGNNIYGYPHDLVLKINGSADQLTIRNYFGGNPNYRIERVEFDDGTVWGAFQLDNLNVNHAPTVAIPIQDQLATQDVPVAFVLPLNTFEDTDPGDSLMFSASLANGEPLPAWLGFDAATGTFSGTPGNENVGILSVRVTATDAGGLSVADTFDLTVANTNDAPMLANALADQAASEDAVFSFTVPASSFTDADTGDVLSYSATLSGGQPLPAWLGFNAATHNFSGTPGNENVGTLSVRVTATDTGGLSVADTFDLTITNTNDAPVLANALADQSARADTAFSFVVPTDAFADVDAGDTLTYSASLANGEPLPVWLGFDAAAGMFSGTPGNDDVGNIAVKVTVTDGAGLTMSDVFDLTVTVQTSNNNPPDVANSLPDLGATESTLFSYTIPAGTFTDPDSGDVLGYSATLANGDPLPGWLGFDADTRTFSGTPPTGTSGVLSLRVSATDPDGASVSDYFDLAIGQVISGSSSADTLNGTVGADIISAGAGNDNVNGDAGNDYILGGSGADTLNGGAGDDVFEVSGDSLYSEDTFHGGEGFDVILGGAGDDTIYVTGLSAANGIERIDGGGGVNVLSGSGDHNLIDLTGIEVLNIARICGLGGNDRITGTPGDDYIVGNGGADILNGGAGNDVFEVTGTAAYSVDTFNGGEGFDTILGGSGNDTIYVHTLNAANGIERIDGGSGTNVLAGDGDHDTIDLTGIELVGFARIEGGGGNDRITGTAGADYLFGHTGNDTLTGGLGNDLLQAGSGDDSLNDGDGSNLLDGGRGIDTLTGGAGAELFIGGTGNDTLSTGAGADVIAFNLGDGQDTVTSSTGQDNTLSLGGGIRYADVSLSKSGSNLVVSVGAADRITLNNWYAATPVRSVLSLQMIAEAMADFDDNGADPLRDDRIETFDFAGLVNAFDAARVANPGLTSWAITNALTSFHLSGSDTAALGGDLAYQYGRYGNLANVGLVGAQNVLNNVQFGAQAQALQSAPGLQEGVVRLS